MKYRYLQLLIVLFLSSAIFGCSWSCPDELPPGYILLKSPEGIYSLMIPNPPNSPFRSSNVWSNACEAKRFAWYFEEYRNKPIERESDSYQWEEVKDENHN